MVTNMLYDLNKNINKDTLINDQFFLQDATFFLKDRGGYKDEQLQKKEDIYDAYMEHFRSQNVNEVTALRDFTYVKEVDQEGKDRMGRLMNAYDHMDSDFGWKALGDYAEGIFTAPSTYAGMFSLGAGKAGALAANQGIKFGIKQALKSGGIRAGLGGMAVEGVAAGGTTLLQENVRVDTNIKQEVDPFAVSLATGLSSITGGFIGLGSGTMRDLSSYAGQRIANINAKSFEIRMNRASKKSAEVFKNDKTKKKAKEFQKKILAEAKEDEEVTKKLALSKTIPDKLERGKELQEFGFTLDEKHIKNISAAASRMYNLIEPSKVLKEGQEERLTSILARGLSSNTITSDQLNNILKEHGLSSLEDLASIYAREISEAGAKLGEVSAIKKKLKEVGDELINLNEQTLEQGLGSSTTKATKKIAEEEAKRNIGTGAWKYVQDLSKARVGLMTIQMATTVRNTTNGFMRNYVYALDNMSTGLIKVTKGKTKEMFSSDEQVKRIGRMAVKEGQADLRAGLDSVWLKDMHLGMTSAPTNALFKILADKKIGNNEVMQNMLRSLADVGHIGENIKAESGLLKIARNLNYFNTMSDNMFKRAIFSRELDKLIRANPSRFTVKSNYKTGEEITEIVSSPFSMAKKDYVKSTNRTYENLDDLLRHRRYDLIQADDIQKAMNEAFEFTYQTGDFKRRDGFMNQFAFKAIMDIGNNPFGATAIPFPRYLINQARFWYSHAPAVGAINLGGILNKPGRVKGRVGAIDLSPESLGRQLTGVAMLGAFYGLRKNYGDETTGAYEFKSGEDLYDTRALLGPFTPYAFAADWYYRQKNPEASKKGISKREFSEAALGGLGRGGTGLWLIDGLFTAMQEDFSDVGLDEKLEFQAMKATTKFLGNVANTFTVGAGMLKDIAGQFDPELLQLPDNTDVNFFDYFLKQSGRSFPIGVDEDRPMLESPTRVGGVRRVDPIIKQLTGLTPLERRTAVEEELKRLKIDYLEISPKNIAGNDPMSNKMRGIMGQLVGNDLAFYMKSDRYQAKTDLEKLSALKNKWLPHYKSKARQAALTMIRNPLITLAESYNITHDAVEDNLKVYFVNKITSKLDRKLLKDHYERKFNKPFAQAQRDGEASYGLLIEWYEQGQLDKSKDKDIKLP